MQKDSPAALSVICDTVGGPPGMFLIQLSDKNNVILSKCQRRENRTAKFSVKAQGVYMITVIPCSEERSVLPMGASRWVMLAPGGHSLQFFRFLHAPRCKPPPVAVRFSLTDAHYPNLPINEGELNLWRIIQYLSPTAPAARSCLPEPTP